MLKKLSCLLLAVSCSISADEQSVSEYTGKIADLYIGKSNAIKVGIVREESNELNCETYENNQWPLFFERDKSYSEEWFGILNTVRRTQETIRIGYTASDDSSCSIEYLALLKDDGIIPDGDSAGDTLQRGGQFGNIAMIYTNNLIESSYSSSDHEGGDIAAAAFDGYLWQEQIKEDVGSLVNRGIWVTKKDKSQNAEHWLQVEFSRVVDITGFRIMVNEKSVELGRSPRGITILTSQDGEDFTKHGSFTLSKTIDQRANLNSIAEAKYFRIQLDSNYGDSRFEIDELEVYSD